MGLRHMRLAALSALPVVEGGAPTTEPGSASHPDGLSLGA